MPDSPYNRSGDAPRFHTPLHELRERLAELEHEQWSAWSKSVAETEELSAERTAGWRDRWVPYASLPEQEKELDREYADRVLDLLHQLGILPGAGKKDD